MDAPAVRARPPKNMVWIPGGAFAMGSEDFYPEERPVHDGRGRRLLDGRAPGHRRGVPPVREGHRARHRRRAAPGPARLPRTPTPSSWCPGSLVFTPPVGPVRLDDFRAWWSWTPGAQWRHPEGPGSTLHGRELHPVTHVAYEDAAAYAAWAGQGAAHRGRVGVRGARRARGRDVRLG